MPFKSLEKRREYHREYARLHKRKNSLAHKRASLKWYKANRVKISERFKASPVEWKMLRSAKSRAKRFGLDFNLVLSDIVVPDVCPALGIPIIKNSGKTSPGSPSLDRILPALGYIRGNVVVISHRANMIKSNASSSEIFLVAQWAESFGI